jgi:hypothetical protein
MILVIGRMVAPELVLAVVFNGIVFLKGKTVAAIDCCWIN